MTPEQNILRYLLILMNNLKTPITIAILGIIIAALLYSKQTQKELPVKGPPIEAKILNGGFEEQKIWESFIALKGANIKIGQTDKEAHTGECSAILENHEEKRPNVYGAIYQRIPCKPNTAYILSYWVKSKDVKGNPAFLTCDSKWNDRTYIPHQVDGSMDWTQADCKFKTGAADFFNMVFVSEGVGTIWLDDIEIKEMK